MNPITLLFLLSFLSCQTIPPSSSKIISERITHIGKSYDVVKVDLNQTNLRMHWLDKSQQRHASLDNLKRALAADQQYLSFAMNGGMYLKNGPPQGLYIENGKQVTPLDTIQNAYGNFYLQPNGVFFLKENEGGVISSNAFQQLNSSTIQYATQSGPMLIVDGNIHSAFREGSSNLHIRNGVGQISETELVFIISNERVNLYEFAQLFKDHFKCPQALYLDGFVSRAYISDLKREDLDGNFGVIISD